MFACGLWPVKKAPPPAASYRKTGAGVGGVLALSACYIGKAAGLLYCLGASALFALWCFKLVFDRRCGWNIGVRCFFRLLVWFNVRSPAWSPARRPASGSWRHRPVCLVCICRCRLSRLHTRALSADTSWSGPSGPVIHAPALRSDISILEASWASAGHRPLLHHHVPASKTLAVWAIGASWSLEVLAKSTLTWSLPALDVLIWALDERAVWAWSLSALDVLVRTLAPRAIWTRCP